MPVWISLTAYAVTYTTIIIIQNALLKKKSRRLAKALVDMQSRITAGADKRPMCANTLSERVALLSLNKFDGIHIAVENGLVLRIFMAGLVDLLALGRIKLTSVDDSTSDHAKVLISVVDTAATGNIALSLLLCKLRDRQQKAGDAPIDLARWLYTLLSKWPRRQHFCARRLPPARHASRVRAGQDVRCVQAPHHLQTHCAGRRRDRKGAQ
eukprot:TRINITY_DN2648_c0_g2_i2.p1 TRINITY_DN2648_c0_g2~~TRINITY_DN2648_c0_g2_i2.p1  ORF type:complete len:225 (-),score=58.61 TRINITY_DN2648_c0_g2_i2:244-876(-)